jgi:hypothetical protein
VDEAAQRQAAKAGPGRKNRAGGPAGPGEHPGPSSLPRRQAAALLAAWLLPGPAAQAATPEQQVLARQAGLDDDTVQAVAGTGTGLHRLVGADANGMERPARGLTVEVPSGRAAAEAELLRRRLGPGHVVWVSQRRHGIDRQPDHVSVIRADDPLEPLRVMNTSGPNYHLSARRVVAKVRDWDRRYGVQLVGAGFDWLEARLRRLPENLRAFAVEVYEFCPDVVNEVQTVDRLALEIQLTRSLYLWWD